MKIRSLSRVAVAISALLVGAAAQAEDPEQFYNGKSLDVYIGFTAGGGYDLYGRLLAKHLRKHVPGNPNVVAKNMEGAGSLRLANWLYTIAPKDGTVIGTIARGSAFDPLLSRPGTQFEAAKFSWIGSITNEVSVCVTWHTTGAKTIDDIKARQVIVGAVGTGSGADDDEFPRVINGLLGTKMKVINGYPGGNEVILAMERGEVNGRCGWSWSSLKASRPSWIENHSVNILAQLGLSKHPDLPNVPLITDLAQTDEQRQIFKLIFARQELARPFLAPPGVPADRLKVLRKAFMDTVRDPEFLADAARQKMEVNPVPGERVQELVEGVYGSTPPEVAKKAAAMLRVD